MDLNKVQSEILEVIEKGNFDGYTKFTMQIAMAQFVYLLECLERDFKDKQTKQSDKGKEPVKV